MNNIKTTLLFSTLSIFCTSMIFSQPEEIVCISGQEVMNKSEAGEALQAKLKAAQEEATKPLEAEGKKLQQKQQQLLASQTAAQNKQQELQAKKDALDADVAEFEKTATALSEEARNKKIEPLQTRSQTLMDEKRKFDRMVQELEDDGVEFTRMQQKLQAEVKKVEAKIQALSQKEMGTFDNLIRETIQEVAQKEGWSMVLMQESLVYAHPNKSKTALIITELNKKTKAINQAKKQAIEKNNTKKETSVITNNTKPKQSDNSDKKIKSYG